MVRITRKPRWLALRPRRRRQRRLCWCRMKRRPSVGWMDFAAYRRGIGCTAQWERRALAPYKSCWHYYVRPGLNLSRNRKLDTASPVILIYRKCSGGLGRVIELDIRVAFCIFAAVRDVVRFFRLIENYGFMGEQRCMGEPPSHGRYHSCTRNAFEISV